MTENPLEPYYGQVGPGWKGILQTLGAKLAPLGITSQDVGQVKEKFGGLRVYLDRYLSEAEAAVKEAEDQASVTCEVCGEPGTIRDDRAWILTLCDVDAGKQRPGTVSEE